MPPTLRISANPSARPIWRRGTSASGRTAAVCGTPAQGAQVYADHGCAACHGDKGSGGPGGPLVGGGPLNAPDKEAQKLIGNYWPYATTVFDFIRRAMPWQQPKTLSDNEV